MHVVDEKKWKRRKIQFTFLIAAAILLSIGGLEGTVKQLAQTFGGAATVQANTFEGQIARLKVGFDEAKESVGAALLPTLQRLLDYFINTVIPKFIEFKDAALKPVTDAIARNKESLTILYNFIKDFVVPILIKVIQLKSYLTNGCKELILL